MTQASPMPTLNLLPACRRARSARARLLSAWLTAAVLLAVGSFIPAGALALGTGDDLSSIRSRIQRNRDAVARLQTERPSLERELSTLRERGVLLDRVDDRIDWIPILGGIASAVDSARFEQIELRLSEPGDRIDVRLVGLAETQSDARALVLRLEDLNLIRGITMNTNRVSLERDVYRFDIAGRISSGSLDQ